jgi:hypothetical protein
MLNTKVTHARSTMKTQLKSPEEQRLEKKRNKSRKHIQDDKVGRSSEAELCVQLSIA